MTDNDSTQTSKSAKHPRLTHLLQFRMIHLMVLTAAVAFGSTALVNASGLWVAATFSLTFLILTGAILLAIYRNGAARAYAVGFALSGWLYFSLVLFWPNPKLPSYFLTTEITTQVYLKGLPLVRSVPEIPQQNGDQGSVIGTMKELKLMKGVMQITDGSVPPHMFPFSPNKTDFTNVGHGLWTLILASLGGLIASYFYATGPAANSTDKAQD